MSHHVTGTPGAREDLCRFLSACYCEPSTDFSEERLFESMQAAAAAIDPDLAKSARKLGVEFLAQDMQTLLVDYTALFIGPGQARAMPYASFWLTDDPSMRHEATLAVLDFYAQGGFDVSEEIHELPDHIAVELEFLYALVFKQNDAQGGGSSNDFLAARVLESRFLAEHLGAWVGEFTSAVASGAETEFYRELAWLTHRFVSMEGELLLRTDGLPTKCGTA